MTTHHLIATGAMALLRTSVTRAFGLTVERDRLAALNTLNEVTLDSLVTQRISVAEQAFTLLIRQLASHANGAERRLTGLVRALKDEPSPIARVELQSVITSCQRELMDIRGHMARAFQQMLAIVVLVDGEGGCRQRLQDHIDATMAVGALSFGGSDE